ncbi:lipopolysaccharide biosynthesis protein [Pseudomonas sp. GCM10022186]|uniref:lipopolysaccharide biosynthesis protein n=1 Tax=Pseudomonas sp. GCM10022186 TaxID=3252650 RepID=UPI003612793C
MEGVKVLGWKDRLLNNRFLTGVLTLASATAAGQIILVLATPLLTRLYTPEQFGLLAVFIAVMSVVLVVSSLRYEIAIPLPRHAWNARLLLHLSLAINLAMAAVSLVVVAVFREDIARLTKNPGLADYLWLLPVAIVFAGSYKALSYWAVRNNDYPVIARTKIVQSIANVATQVVAGLIGLGALGLILGQVIGQTAGAARLAKGTGLRERFSLASLRGARARALLREHRHFPKYDAPAATVDALSVQLPNVLLAALFNPFIAGLYMLAERVLSMPMGLLGQAVGQVLFGSSREALKNGTLDRLALKIVSGLSAIIFAPVIVIFFWAGDLFAWIFGEAWRESGVYASWMMLGLSVQFLYSPISMVLMATNGQKINLFIHLFMLFAKTAVLVYGYHLGSPLAAIIGFSMVGVVGYAASILIILAHARKYSARS